MNFTPEQQAERENFVAVLRNDVNATDGESIRDAIARLKAELADTRQLLRDIRGSDNCLCPCCMRLAAYQYATRSDE